MSESEASQADIFFRGKIDRSRDIDSRGWNCTVKILSSKLRINQS